jgi:hypothetical protein
VPTISESLWSDKKERIARYVEDYIKAAPRTIDASEDVLTARLFGLGLRGQDLYLEVHKASLDKYDKRADCPLGGKCPHYGTCMNCLQGYKDHQL